MDAKPKERAMSSRPMVSISDASLFDGSRNARSFDNSYEIVGMVLQKPLTAEESMLEWDIP